MHVYVLIILFIHVFGCHEHLSSWGVGIGLNLEKLPCFRSLCSVRTGNVIDFWKLWNFLWTFLNMLDTTFMFFVFPNSVIYMPKKIKNRTVLFPPETVSIVGPTVRFFFDALMTLKNSKILQRHSLMCYLQLSCFKFPQIHSFRSSNKIIFTKWSSWIQGGALPQLRPSISPSI